MKKYIHINQHNYDDTIYDRECDNCGNMTNAFVGFLKDNKIYCEDCCPDNYGEN
tara:strand:+ start:406 stop:567 length:162 start_codon:yes stop_codon:yes gene_type:complete